MKNYNSIICTLIASTALIISAAILTIEVNVTVTEKLTQHVGEVHTAKVKERK